MSTPRLLVGLAFALAACDAHGVGELDSTASQLQQEPSTYDFICRSRGGCVATVFVDVAVDVNDAAALASALDASSDVQVASFEFVDHDGVTPTRFEDDTEAGRQAVHVQEFVIGREAARAVTRVEYGDYDVAGGRHSLAIFPYRDQALPQVHVRAQVVGENIVRTRGDVLVPVR